MRRIYLLIITLIFFTSFLGPLKASTAQDASQALVTAQLASQAAYTAIRSAQVAGANTSSLANQFNNALISLQAAESADTAGNYNTTVTQAQKATQIFNTIQTQALALKSAADSQNTLWSAVIIVSSLASFALVTLGFRFVERWRRRRWLKRLPQMRIILKEEKHEDS